MFTVKFFAEPSTGFEDRVLIVEADTITIIPLPQFSGYLISAVTAKQEVNRVIRYMNNDEREGRVGFEIGGEPYWRAIIENSNGKTTQIVTAKQLDPIAGKVAA